MRCGLGSISLFTFRPYAKCAIATKRWRAGSCAFSCAAIIRYLHIVAIRFLLWHQPRWMCMRRSDEWGSQFCFGSKACLAFGWAVWRPAGHERKNGKQTNTWHFYVLQHWEQENKKQQDSYNLTGVFSHCQKVHFFNCRRSPLQIFGSHASFAIHLRHQQVRTLVGIWFGSVSGSAMETFSTFSASMRSQPFSLPLLVSLCFSPLFVWLIGCLVFSPCLLDWLVACFFLLCLLDWLVTCFFLICLLDWLVACFFLLCLLDWLVTCFFLVCLLDWLVVCLLDCLVVCVFGCCFSDVFICYRWLFNVFSFFSTRWTWSSELIYYLVFWLLDTLFTLCTNFFRIIIYNALY